MVAIFNAILGWLLFRLHLSSVICHSNYSNNQLIKATIYYNDNYVLQKVSKTSNIEIKCIYDQNKKIPVDLYINNEHTS